MSIPRPGAIWRIIEAVSRPIDQPIGVIHLETADADWLCSHLLELVAHQKPRRGAPSRNNNHIVWAAIDVELRMPMSKNSLKVAQGAVAVAWNTTDKKVASWHATARDTAQDLIKQSDKLALGRLVLNSRAQYLERVNKKPSR